MSAATKDEVRPSLHHVNIKTSRLDEMIKWYGLVVGTQEQFRFETGAWTTNDGANHRIAFLAVPGLSDDADKVRHNGMHHCAFEYGSFAELMSTYDRLRQSGVEPVFSLDHGMTMSLYYKDPDGNFVELQSDNFSGWKLSGEYMRESPQFAANPIGVYRVYETFKSRTDFETLENAVYAGAFLPDPTPNIGLPG